MNVKKETFDPKKNVYDKSDEYNISFPPTKFKVRFTQKRMTTYLAKSDTIVEPLHEVVNVNVEVRVEALQPLGQIFFHGVQILLARLERPERSRVQ